MIRHIAVIILAALRTAAVEIPTLQSVGRTTAERISEHNYPVETHNVHTTDGYILTLFRIPYSPRLQNRSEHRPAAFLQHGFLSNSNDWIRNGPDKALAYLLADAGYDVWLGNVRGNTYSRRHETLSPSLPSFWDFSFHEIAFYDVAASIDYIFGTTGESGLHYVGHSMGTTIFFTLMSVRPEYNAKIKTAHLLAPVAFTSQMRGYLVPFSALFLGYPSIITDIFERNEFLPNRRTVSWVLSIACSNESPLQPVCTNALSLLFGWNSTHLNTSLIADLLETYPAGASTNINIHFVQEYVSGHFRWYDHGPAENLIKYKQISPPDYNVSNIVAPVRLYYSDNDYIADVPDVKKIEGLLPNLVESFHVPYPDWNHLDFLLAVDAKETLYDRIINSANRFESTGSQ